MKIRATMIIRWAAALGILIFLICHFSNQRISNTPMDQVEAAVTQQLDMSAMQKGDHQMFRRLYGLDPAQFEDVCLYYPSTNMGAEELLLVRLKEVSQAEAVRSAVQSRIDTQKNSFEGYGVQQYELLTTHAVIQIAGNYVLFVVSPQAEAAEDAFLKTL